jgi:hypothetical protein
MLSPLAAQADDAGYAANSSTSVEVAMERMRLVAQARSYAERNSGHIGVSVLKGRDAPAPGPELAAAIEGGVEAVSGKQAEGFDGDNGNKATEIAFHIPFVHPNGSVTVQTRGPYNIDDAADVLRNWETAMAPSYTTVSLD